MNDQATQHALPEGAIYRPVTMAKRIVFVDGVARCGKSMLGPILASLNSIEIERIEQIFEYIGQLYAMGKIDRFAAIALLRHEADEFLYNSYLSRNTNFRWQDHSGVFRNPRPWRYLRRLFNKEGSPNLAALFADQPIFQTQTHDQMAFIDLHLDAWPDELKVIELRRHAVELIDSWRRRKWGTRFGQDPMALTICLHHDGEAVPYYAQDWAKEYLRLGPMDRIIRILHERFLANRTSYENLPPERKRKIFVLRFEDYVTDPYSLTEDIASFLGTESSRSTPTAIRRQGCPRVVSLASRDTRLTAVRAEASQESQALIDELIAESETDWV